MANEIASDTDTSSFSPIANTNFICETSVDQMGPSVYSLHMPCTLSGSRTYILYAIADIDGQYTQTTISETDIIMPRNFYLIYIRV